MRGYLLKEAVAAISSDSVKYDHVDSHQKLMNKVMQYKKKAEHT